MMAKEREINRIARQLIEAQRENERLQAQITEHRVLLEYVVALIELKRNHVDMSAGMYGLLTKIVLEVNSFLRGKQS